MSDGAKTDGAAEQTPATPATTRPIEAREVFLIAGVLLLGIGFATIHPALGLGVPGAILTAIAVFGVRR